MSSNRPEKLLYSTVLSAPVETSLISLDVEQQRAQKWHTTLCSTQSDCDTLSICRYFSFSAKWLEISIISEEQEHHSCVQRLLSMAGVFFMCRLSSWTGNLSEERMTSVFKDCCRLLSCLLVFSGLVSAWACLCVIGGPAGAVMGMTGSLSQRTPGDTHLLYALSSSTVFTEEWGRQVLQPVWSVWKQKTTADREAVSFDSAHTKVWHDTNMLIFLPHVCLCGNIGYVLTFSLPEQMEANRYC